MVYTKIKKEKVNGLTEFFKVLGDNTRMQIVLSLADGERCVGEISELLNSSPSAISHQLKALKYAGQVKSRKEGKNIYYSLDDNHILEILETALAHVDHKTS